MFWHWHGSNPKATLGAFTLSGVCRSRGLLQQPLRGRLRGTALHPVRFDGKRVVVEPLEIRLEIDGFNRNFRCKMKNVSLAL